LGLGIFYFFALLAGCFSVCLFPLYFSWVLCKTFGWILYTHGTESGRSLLLLVRIVVTLVIGIDNGNISVPSQITITVSGFLSIK
jgi:hypothetical protein